VTIKKLKPWRFDDWFRFTLAAALVREQVDRELGDLLLAVSAGDDSKLAAVHDRLNVLGRFDDADKIRKILEIRG
jgi:hypothetical protein